MSERLSGLALTLEGGWGWGRREGEGGGGARSDAAASMDQ